MPTITSNTFAYSEVEKNLKIKLTFQNILEFEDLLETYMYDFQVRQNYSQQALHYINSELPESKLSRLWRKVFN